MILVKAQRIAARLNFYFFSALALLTGGVSVFLLTPIYSWFFFNDLRWYRYYGYIYPVIKTCYNIVWDWISNPEYMQAFLPSLTSPPSLGPDLSKIKISENWKGSVSSCDGCVKCCAIRKCPLYNRAKEGCMSYGSFFWRYFNCGTYPVNARQIDHYNCPKWVMGTDTNG